MAKKSKKVKVPSSIFELEWSLKKFAKKHHIRVKGKGMSGKRRREAQKKLMRLYAESTINNLNKAVKILSENSDSNSGKVERVRDAVDIIIRNNDIMRKIAKLYTKTPKQYPDLIYLPYMISNTIIRYQDTDKLSEEEKTYAETLDKTALLEFCERILKKQIRHYRKRGFTDVAAFELANCIPSSKLFLEGRSWYKNLIQKLYMITAIGTIDIDAVLAAVRTVDKKRVIKKADFLVNFYLEVILTKSSNKSLNYNDTQKEFHESLIESTVNYLDGLKEKQLREVLKTYIRKRKTAEEYKTDGKRLIRFIDYANSNSSHLTIKTVVQDLISDNSNNELYLS